MKVFANDKFKGLKAKQRLAIEMLLNFEMTQKDIAEKCEVSEKTLYNWMHNNDLFREALDWYRREIYRELAPEAVKRLAEIMRSGEDREAIKAVEKILSFVGDDAKQQIELSTEKDWSFNITVTDKEGNAEEDNAKE